MSTTEPYILTARCRNCKNVVAVHVLSTRRREDADWLGEMVLDHFENEDLQVERGSVLVGLCVCKRNVTKEQRKAGK